MSRLIVKNLPKYFTEDNLKEHFAKKYPDITDVKLMKGRNGESRRFAFLGFKSLEDAENAVKYFDNTFIHTAKIQVQLAKTFADPTVPRPMKEMIRERQRRLEEHEERLKRKQQEEEDYRAKRIRVNATADVDQEIANNPRLKEFLEATKSSAKVSSWDDGIIGTVEKSGNQEPQQEPIPVDQESDDEYQQFAKTPTLRKKQDESEEGEKMISLKDFDNKEEQLVNDDDEDVVSEEKPNDGANENISDLDWLHGKRKLIKDNKSEAEINNDPIEKRPTKEQPQIAHEEPVQESTEDQIRKTGRLFIRNILYTASEEDFTNLFQGYGELEEVHIAIDTRTHKSKGFVYIQFKNPEDAVQGYYSLDKQIFQGRLLHILPGQIKKSHKLDEFDLKNLPLKKQRELKRKFEATKSTFSWNSLFLNETAVLEAVASKIGVDKRDLVDPESSGSAVKQALAEAHVIGDVRKYFEGKGIDLTSFNKKEKDDKIILVKNFPYDTTVTEITELFSQYGELNRVLFPPTGAIAIVEFKNVPAGRSAFTKLAYRRFKKNILYLEKGPKDLFSGEVRAEDKVETVEKKSNVKETKLSVDDLVGKNDDASEDENDNELPFAGITTSVFVKNLNFKTTSQDLLDIFKTCTGFIVAKVSTKPDSKTPGKTLSMGFGFVEFKTKDQALDCIKKNDGKIIDDHKIQLKLSHRKSEVTNSASSANKVSKGKKSTKIIVKNLPFEATRKDVFELFSSFGQLKSVRVPKKFNKSARGFAFVEFSLLKEAENAMDSLRGVHLLGRRLNIDYAEKDAENAEEEIAKMTEKVKKQKNLTEYANAAKLNGKKRVELENDEEGF